MVVIENTAVPGLTGWNVMSGTSKEPVAAPVPVRSIVAAIGSDVMWSGWTLVPATVTCTVVSSGTEPTRVRSVSDSAAGTVTVQCWLVMVRSPPVMTGLRALAVTTNVRMFGSGDAGLRHDAEYSWVPSTSVCGVVVVVVGAAVVVVVGASVEVV